MATPLVIEEERGTCTGNRHPHNGYYAGDFSTTRAASSSSWFTPPADVVALPFTRAQSLRTCRRAA